MAETSFIQKQEIVSTQTASAASSELSGLNDLQLKALLEEAITYKRPKDREGKSDLFKELLQEAEAESETNKEIRSSTATSAARPIPRRRLSRRGPSGDTGGTSAPGPVLWDGYHNSSSNSTSVTERQTRGGSLQNIVHACTSETFSFKPTTTIIKSNEMTSEHQTSLSSQQNSTSNKCDRHNGVEMLLLAPLNNNNISNTNHNNNNNNNGSNIKHRTTSTATTNVTEVNKTITVTTLSTNKMPYPTNSVSEELQKSDSSNKSNVTHNSARRHENITAVVNGLDNVAFPLNSAYNCVRSLGVASSLCHTSTHTAALSALTEKISSNKCTSVFDKMAAISQSKEPASTLVTASLATPVTSSAAAVASISEAISHQPQSTPNSVTTSKQGGSSFSISNSWLSDGQRFPLSNTLDSKNKVDENFNTNISSSSGTKHKRRNKVNSLQNVIMSQNIAGYRGDTDNIEDLVQFIESSSTPIGSTNSGNNINSNNQTSTSVNASISHNQHSSNDGHKMLPTNSSKKEIKHQNKTKNHSSTTSSRRQSQSNLKKSTSMEEIHSRTKFEDLTNQSSTTTTTPPQNSASNNEKTSNPGGQISRRKKDNARAERRSWGNEETSTNQEVGLVLNNNNSNTSNKSSNPSLVSNINEPQDSSSSWADVQIVIGVEASPSPVLLSPHNLTTASCSNASIGGQPSPDFHLVKKKNRKSKSTISNNASINTSNSYIQQTINFSSGSRRSRSGENRNHSNNNNNYHYPSGQNSSNSHYNKETPYRGKSSFSGINQEDTINTTNSSQNRNNSRPFYTKYQTIQVTVADCRSKTYSVPPSDKSDSSDVDSVHSLPVSSTTVRPTIEKTSTSSGSTPQASYADIARTTSQMPSSCQSTTPPLTPNTSSFPDSSFVSSSTSQTAFSSPTPINATHDISFNLATAGQWPCVCSSTIKQGPVTTPSPTSEQPPLIKTSPQGQQTKKDAGTNTNTDEIVFTNHEQAQHLSQILQINQGPDHSSKTLENYGLCPPSRHKSNHGITDIARPPVIILNHSDSSLSDNLEQFSFGFEINQALLNEDNNLEDESQQTQETTTIGNSPPTPRLEIIAPAIPHHRDLVNYINNSWNEILRSVENKNSIYYSSELS